MMRVKSARRKTRRGIEERGRQALRGRATQAAAAWRAAAAEAARGRQRARGRLPCGSWLAIEQVDACMRARKERQQLRLTLGA
jgi:hypothetical protein